MVRLWSIPAVTAVVLAACDGTPPRQLEPTSEAANSVTKDNEVEVASNGTATAESQSTANVSAPTQAAFSASGYRLIGTEPFWGGTASADQIVYSTPDNQSGEAIAVIRRFEQGREIYSGSYNKRPFVLTLSAGPCSDGMSDNVHEFTASLEVDGETRVGCANPRS